MPLCLINRKRLLAFDPNPTIYKEIQIGDIIGIPDEQAWDLYNDLVIVTGFNIKHQIVYWKARSMHGGICHSSTYLKYIKEHLKRNRKS
jgi:hypothetical protein